MKRSALVYVAVITFTLFGAFFLLVLPGTENIRSADPSPTAPVVENPQATTSTTTVPSDPPSPSVHIGGETVRVRIADTPQERERGLSGTARLGDDEGMLFIFPESGAHSFWMKDMSYSIDIIWVSEDGRVVHIAENVSPESYPASFVPPGPAKYVLEVNAGFVRAHNIALGNEAGLLR